MDDKLEPRVKNGFSERRGIKRFSDIAQVDDLNKRTRNLLFNCLREAFFQDKYNFACSELFWEHIYVDYFSYKTIDIPSCSSRGENIARFMDTGEYSAIMDLIEACIRELIRLEKEGLILPDCREDFITNVNRVLENENVNYRIVGNIVCDVVNKEEIAAIDETLSNPNEVIRKHYNAAARLFFKDKDYANSIKESISAVESACRAIDPAAKTLSDVLKKKENEIHPALKEGYLKLYAFTSDDKGIRHGGGIGEKNATAAEARYMLISCAAFVNYLSEIYR